MNGRTSQLGILVSGMLLPTVALAQTAGERPAWLTIQPHRPEDPQVLTVGLVLAGVVLLAYLIMWWAVGRDPQKGRITLQTAPPKGLSPAAVRFIIHETCDATALVAAFVSLALKGVLYLRDSDEYSLTRQEGPHPGEAITDQLRRLQQDAIHENLTGDERTLALLLFRRQPTITLGGSHWVEMNEVAIQYAARLRALVHGRYCRNNAGYVLAGMACSILALMVASQQYTASHAWNHLITTIGGLAAFGLAPFWVPFISQVWRGAGAVMLHPSRHGCLLSLMGLAVTALLILGGYFLVYAPRPLLILLLVLALLNALFAHLLRAPTEYGRRVLDHLEGYRRFLAEGEVGTLKPADFEHHLPYALALGVGHAWAERCRPMLNRSSASGIGYIAGWYANATFRRGGIATLVAELETAWPNAVGRIQRQGPWVGEWDESDNSRYDRTGWF